MSEFKFPVVLNEGDGKAVVTAFNANSASPVFIADEFHPHWDAIIKGLREGDDNVWSLFDVAEGVVSRFKEITDRVSWNGSEILWDGSPVHSVLTEQLSRAIREGDARNYTAVAKFWEKLESNPNEHSRAQAYEFLAAHQFQITVDGDVVGYKGVTSVEGKPGVFRSTAKSQVAGKPSAYVNGVPQPELSYVEQKVGDIVTMPRDEVVHDPTQSCERGLHVATHSYAQSYGSRGAVLLVTMNPRDIVSVPDDARGEKVRVRRYEVIGFAGEEAPSNNTVLRQDTVQTRWEGVGYTPI